jgi:hypothetical protein
MGDVGFSTVAKWFAKSFENQWFVTHEKGGIQKKHHVSGGLFSGVRITTLINTVLNMTYHDATIQRLSNELPLDIELCTSKHLGDDIITLFPRAYKNYALRYIACFLESEKDVNPTKQLASSHCGEFLRIMYQDGEAWGSPARCCASLVHGNIESSYPVVGLSRLRNIVSSCCNMSRRGCVLWKCLALCADAMAYTVAKNCANANVSQVIDVIMSLVALTDGCGTLYLPTSSFHGNWSVAGTKSIKRLIAPIISSCFRSTRRPLRSSESGALDKLADLDVLSTAYSKNKHPVSLTSKMNASTDLMSWLSSRWGIKFGGERKEKCLVRLICSNLSIELYDPRRQDRIWEDYLSQIVDFPVSDFKSNCSSMPYSEVLTHILKFRQRCIEDPKSKNEDIYLVERVRGLLGKLSVLWYLLSHDEQMQIGEQISRTTGANLGKVLHCIEHSIDESQVARELLTKWKATTDIESLGFGAIGNIFSPYVHPLLDSKQLTTEEIISFAIVLKV